MNVSPIQLKNHMNQCDCSCLSISHLSNNLNLNWHERIVKRLGIWETQLDKFIPPFKLQNSYDEMMSEITKASFDWKEFNNWLENKGNGNWYSQLATFLVKLPLKTARNILQLIGNIIAIGFCVPLEAIMHPMKAPLQIAKLLTLLVHNLIQPETWTKAGAGILGSSLANAAVASNPFHILAIAIGGALVIGGISIGTLKVTLLSQQQDRWNTSSIYFTQQMKNTSEHLLTGFCLGLLIEGAQRVIRSCQKVHHNFKHGRNVNRVNQENQHAQQVVDAKNQKTLTASKNNYIDTEKNNFLNKYELPKPEEYDNELNSFTVRWRPGRADVSIKDLPEGELVRENIQTGVQRVTKDIWCDGHYNKVFGQGYYNDFNIWIEEEGFHDVWISGHSETIAINIPIYEEFFGYRVPVSFSNWNKPPLLPSPTPMPLPIKPPFPAALRLSDEQLQVLGIGPAINDKLEQSKACSPKLMPGATCFRRFTA